MEIRGHAGVGPPPELLNMQPQSKPRILFVDDEPDLLAAIARNLRSEHFKVATASSAVEALETMAKAGPFAAIVSDLRMPGMDGIGLLRTTRELYPDTVRVLFTGQPDLDNAVAAVNEGAIFRFVTKPCSRVTLALTVKGAVEQHRLIVAERELLQQTLRGSIKALTDVLGLASPLAFGRATRLRQSVAALAAALKIAESWHIEVAAMLSQIGSITLPTATLEKAYQGEEMTGAELEMVQRVPSVTEQVLGNIPRLEPVMEILRCQQKRFDGAGPPDGMAGGEAIPWGARALKAVIDLDTLETGGLSPSLAVDTLRGREGWYDPAILAALSETRKSGHRSTVRDLPLTSLASGMVLAQDVRTTKGTLFVARGQEVTAGLIEKFRNSHPGMFSAEPIRVVIPDIPETGAQ
jgi:response regulator RpfG family c-di-GMP phosphodiesterase